MQPAFEQYRSGCRMISILTNLEVQVFDAGRVLQVHVARYDLPAVLEHLRREALVQVLRQPMAKEHVSVFRDALQLEFLAAGIWNEADYHGTVVVGPAISKAFHPQLLREMSQNERVPLTMQKQLQQSYNTLPMVDEAKQQAIGYLLINILAPGMIQPQRIEIALPAGDGTAVKFKYELEQNRELVERRYEVENKILHAIARGDSLLLKKVTEEFKGIPWPYRHPHAPVRSMKNLSLSHNTLFRKAAEGAGVHPLYLDSISGKFAIQIEQAQSIGELEALYEEMPYVYCSAVRELALAAFPPIIKEAIIFIRFNIDQPLSLNHIADTLGVHPSYLSRAFKRELGMTLTDYVNQLRIEEATYLLDHSNASVTEIASSVGFNDSNYFSKVFRKWQRVTPHDYRKQKKEE
ncbi:MAG TPA: AraC family transcriptional regulator [Ktedonobacteraceae bacterium]|nr:AraC family transcriptional regulator [Ktedonobacteraceae bacterium]